MIQSRKFVLPNAFFDDHVLLGCNNYLKNVRPDVIELQETKYINNRHHRMKHQDSSRHILSHPQYSGFSTH